MRLDDDFFIDEPMTAPKPSAPDNAQRGAPSTALSSSSSSSPADKMQLCIELLSDIAPWITSAARKPIEDTITQLTTMLSSVGGNK